MIKLSIPIADHHASAALLWRELHCKQGPNDTLKSTDCHLLRMPIARPAGRKHISVPMKYTALSESQHANSAYIATVNRPKT